MKQTITEKIQQRRLQILIHSCIYYELNDSIISDAQWGKWAKELVDLQNKYPKEAEQVVYNTEFRDFDGSTGMNLPTKEFDVMNRAKYLLQFKDKVKVIKPKKQPGLLF